DGLDLPGRCHQLTAQLSAATAIDSGDFGAIACDAHGQSNTVEQILCQSRTIQACRFQVGEFRMLEPRGKDHQTGRRTYNPDKQHRPFYFSPTVDQSAGYAFCVCHEMEPENIFTKFQRAHCSTIGALLISASTDPRRGRSRRPRR
ncbi:MAG TPA: hypothetical protein VFZ02_03350, partial [Ktedonobacteraceae bacterium]